MDFIARLLGIIIITPNPNRGSINERWSAVVSIGAYHRIVYGVPCAYRLLSLIGGSMFICALVVILKWLLVSF